MDTKKCTKCNKELPVECFRTRRSTSKLLISWCKDCQREYRRQHYKDNLQAYTINSKDRYTRSIDGFKKMVDELKDKPCTDCNKRFHSVAMDFDHLIPNQKKFTISKFLRRKRLTEKSVAELLAEIAKCELVCACCHRVRTYVRLHQEVQEGTSLPEQEQ